MSLYIFLFVGGAASWADYSTISNCGISCKIYRNPRISNFNLRIWNSRYWKVVRKINEKHEKNSAVRHVSFFDVYVSYTSYHFHQHYWTTSEESNLRLEWFLRFYYSPPPQTTHTHTHTFYSMSYPLHWISATFAPSLFLLFCVLPYITLSSFNPFSSILCYPDLCST